MEDMPIGRAYTLVRHVTRQDVDTFANLCGDVNPLHMDDAFGARTPFGQRVVHGLFTGALVSTAHTNLTGPGFVYVGQELRFLGPVFIDDSLTVEVRIVERKEAKRILVLETAVRNQRGERVLEGRSALKELAVI
jgi:acyl dehydratase